MNPAALIPLLLIWRTCVHPCISHLNFIRSLSPWHFYDWRVVRGTAPVWPGRLAQEGSNSARKRWRGTELQLSWLDGDLFSFVPPDKPSITSVKMFVWIITFIIDVVRILQNNFMDEFVISRSEKHHIKCWYKLLLNVFQCCFDIDFHRNLSGRPFYSVK